ncbi:MULTISPECIES: hypothetical protein [Bremerella]
MRIWMIIAILFSCGTLIGCGGSDKPENPDTTDPNMTSAPESPR